MPKKKKINGKTIFRVDYQLGKSHRRRDKGRKGLLPGLRISRNRKRYWEARKNRSDQLDSML